MNQPRITFSYELFQWQCQLPTSRGTGHNLKKADETTFRHIKSQAQLIERAMQELLFIHWDVYSVAAQKR